MLSEVSGGVPCTVGRLSFHAARLVDINCGSVSSGHQNIMTSAASSACLCQSINSSGDETAYAAVGFVNECHQSAVAQPAILKAGDDFGLPRRSRGALASAWIPR